MCLLLNPPPTKLHQHNNFKMADEKEHDNNLTNGAINGDSSKDQIENYDEDGTFVKRNKTL